MDEKKMNTAEKLEMGNYYVISLSSIVGGWLIMSNLHKEVPGFVSWLQYLPLKVHNTPVFIAVAK